MFVCANDKGIVLLEFTNEKDLIHKFEELCKKFNAVILPGNNNFLDKIEKEYKNK